MKKLATILCFGIIGFAQAQSTSRDVEIYERYENGELVEQRQSATENGVPIKDFDFEKAKRDIKLKYAEKTRNMEERMQKAQQSMDLKVQEMKQKMADFEKRSEEMHKRMDQKMKEIEKSTSEPIEKPVVGLSSKNVKFT